MTRPNMLKELGVAVLLVALVSGAIVDDHLPAEHRGGDDGGIPLGPEIPEPAADPAEDPAENPADEPAVADPVVDPATDSDIETELETQLRDSLPPGVLMGPPRGPLMGPPRGPLMGPPRGPLQYRPLYAATWSPYPAPYLLPAVYSAGAPARPLGPPVPWYLAQVRGQRPFLYSGLTGADQPAPSVAASRIYDVTISSAHAPQLAE